MIENILNGLLVNPVLNDKYLDWSKLKTFADDKIDLAQKLEFVYGRVESIVEQVENAGYLHFLLFPQCFQISFPLGVVRNEVCVVMG